MLNSINPAVSKFEKISVFSIIFILYVILIFVSSIGKIEHPAVPGFISICGMSIFIISLQTAFLLYNQSKIRFDSSIALLSSGYLFISFLVLGRIIFLPGTILTSDYLNEDSQIAAWLWTIWHLIFPVYIILYSLTYTKISISYKFSQWIFRLVPIISILIIIFTMLNESYLPKIINGNDYNETMHIDALLFILCIISMSFLIHQKGISHRLDLWLLLAISVHGLDILYGITGGARYSMGWYLGMINSVISSAIILGVFIYQLIQITQSLSNENNHLKNVSEQDELTQIPNRRKFNLIFETLWKLSLHQKKSLCFIMVDIDNFKAYNDTFGHPKGDECLVRIATILKKITNRETDLVARIGGEEFAILLYGIDEKHAVIFAEKTRNMVEEAQIPSAIPQRPFVTVSVGCGVIIPDPTLNYKHFINNVDKALYKSKQMGRNTISFAVSPS